MKNYDEIINLPHHQSKTHPQMSLHDRAAQFAPFAALKGYDDAVVETARLTDRRQELSDYEIAQLDGQLQYLADNVKNRIQVTITHFVEDALKAGGSYVESTGIVKKVDEIEKKIIFTDRTEIFIKDIYSITEME